MTPKQLAAEAMSVFKHAAFDPHAVADIEYVMETTIAAERARCLAHARKWIGIPGSTLPDGDDGIYQDGQNMAAKHIAAVIDSGEPA